jgi:hypothetical protein
MMATYERILRIVILIDGLLGLILLLWPSLLAGTPAGPDDTASTWARGAGLALLLLSLALLPAAFVALANRYLALFAAGTQALLGLFFAVSEAHLAWLLASYFFAVAYILGTAFWRGFQQYLTSKP